MSKNRIGVALIVTLAFALVGQIVVYRLQAPVNMMHASWEFNPKSLKASRDKAKDIVLVEVLTVERGDDIVVPVEGEPNNEDRIPTQRVTLNVIKGYKGAAKKDDLLTLFQTGGTKLPPPPQQGEKEPSTDIQQFILEGDPLYQVGEQYLLMLEPGPNNMLRVTSPEGRYRVEQNGTLAAMVDNAGTRELRGKALKDAETLVNGAKP